MNISYDKVRNEYVLGETRYSKDLFISYIESDMLQSMLAEKPGKLEIEDEVTSGDRLTGATNILLYGVPGVGKSFTIKDKYCSDEKLMQRVVFHPDYSYSDFVGQIMPRVEKNEDGDKLRYIFTPGPFTRIMKQAWDDPYHYYYLIVEEINRGNAPAIFGEIFQLLDRKDEDKYPKSFGESEYGISNYEISEYIFGESTKQVKIPSNLYILATMNSSDQNVFTLDTAFQRRWNLKHIDNEIDKAEHANELIENTKITWGAFADTVNELILEVNENTMGSADKRLGAYFAKKQELTKEKFAEKVLKYLWDDAFKYDKTVFFDGKYKSLDSVIIEYEKTPDDCLKGVLSAAVYERMLKKAKEE